MARNILKPGSLEVPSAGNADRTFEFPTGRHYRSTLYIAGNFNQGASGAGDATAVEDSPFPFVKSLEIKSKLGTYLKSSGQGLYHFAKYEAKNRAPTGSAPAPSGAGDSAFSMRVPIPFSPANLAVPAALMADLRDGEQPKIVVSLDTADVGLATGNTRVHTANTVTCDVNTETEDEVISPSYVRTLEEITKPVTQAQRDFQIDLTARDGRLQRSIQIMAIRGGVRSNALVNRVRVLRASGQAFFEATWDDIREVNAQWLGAARDTGLATIDWDTMRNLAGLPNTAGFSAYKLEFDVNSASGVTEIRVLCDNVIERAKFAQ